jgi:Fe-S-cluster containining protein
LPDTWEEHGRVCREKNCHECCVETEMPLTEEDVRRLAASGFKSDEFSLLTEEGDIILRNRGGVCFFLRDGACAAYADRPEGCRVYPLVLNTDTSHFIIDQFCPHNSEFKAGREDKDRLKALIRRLDKETEKRLRLRR